MEEIKEQETNETESNLEKGLEKYPEDIRKKIIAGRKIEKDLEIAKKVLESAKDPEDLNKTDPQEPEQSIEPPVQEEQKTDQVQESEDQSQDQSNQEAEEWKNRFINFKKSADKTIYNLRQENKALTESVNLLTTKVEKLESIADEYNKIKHQELTGKLSEELGDDSSKVIDAYVKKALEPLARENEELKNEIAKLNKITSQVTATNASQDFINKVRSAVPNFDLIDNDPRFMQYLDQIDPLSVMILIDFFI